MQADLFAQDKFHVMAIGSKYDTEYFWLNFEAEVKAFFNLVDQMFSLIFLKSDIHTESGKLMNTYVSQIKNRLHTSNFIIKRTGPMQLFIHSREVKIIKDHLD